MALNLSSLLPQLDPIRPLGSPSGGSGLERERLRMMRETAQARRQEWAERLALRQMEEQGRNARAELEAQQQKQAAKEAARLDAYKEFTKFQASGDYQGAQAMVPLMSQLGMRVELEGSEGGLPRYRVDMDAAQAAQAEAEQAATVAPRGPVETPEQELRRQTARTLGMPSGGEFQGETAQQSLGRMEGLGYPSELEQGGAAFEQELATPPPGLSTAGAFEQAQLASRFAEETGRPFSAPEEPDAMGAVPSNVFDAGAMAMATRQRLDPALSGFVQAYPEHLRQSAEATAEGVRALALPAEKSMEQFRAMRAAPDAAMAAERDAAFEAQKTKQAASWADDKEAFDREQVGWKEFGGEIASNYDLKPRLKSRGLNQEVMNLLSNATKEDDLLALSYIVRSFGERGATTEGDTGRALGLPATNLADRVFDWIRQQGEGGMPESSRQALIGVMRRTIANNDAQLWEAHGRMRELIDDPETDRSVAKGLEEYWRTTIPSDMRERWRAEQEQRQASAPAGSRAPLEGGAPIPERLRERFEQFDIELESQAMETFLDPEAIKVIIGLESGGNPRASNRSGARGLIQFMPKTAEGLGTTTAELSQMTAEEQVPYVVEFFKRAGLDEDSDLGDYAVAVAATGFVGKPDDTVVYEKGSEAWKQNKPWRPEDGGDITVGSIKAAYQKKLDSWRKKAESKGLAQSSAKDDQAALDLMR